MKIIVADHYGLCFGVRDAIAEAEQLTQDGPLTILGELVHNPVVRDRLAARGVQEGSLADLSSADGPRVLITAHGASDAARARWNAAGYAVADATCPLVHQAHDQLRALVAAGCVPVVIGKRGHVEVNGLAGDFPECAVIESEADLPALPERARFGVIAQTTQPIDRVLALVEALRRARPQCEVLFRDTVCQPTKNRQAALRKLLEQAQTLVVVGGKNSNNTRELAARGRAAGLRVFHVERAEELQADWFQDQQTVGVTAGTSTLKETVSAVVARLESFAVGCASPMSHTREEPVAAGLASSEAASNP